jgi:hypothetical protein
MVVIIIVVVIVVVVFALPPKQNQNKSPSALNEAQQCRNVSLQFRKLG